MVYPYRMIICICTATQSLAKQSDNPYGIGGLSWHIQLFSDKTNIEWASARVPPTPLLGGWLSGGLAPTWAFLGLCSLFSLANWASCPEGSDSVRYFLSSDNHPFWSATTLLCTTFFFPGGSVRLLKIRIFQKSSRQWVRAPGHDMGPGKKYHTKEGPDFFAWKLPDVQWQEISFCLLWLRGGWSISLSM